MKMHRSTLVRTLTLVAAALALLVAAGGRLAAQDATPAAQPITDTVLGRGLPTDAPGKALTLERITIAPGAAIPTHVHPGAYVIYVESGDFGFAVVKGEAQFTRGGADAAEETVQAGAEVVAHQGDTLFENAGVVHSARNAGDTPVVVLTASLLAADEPSLQPTNDDGTPTS